MVKDVCVFRMAFEPQLYLMANAVASTLLQNVFIPESNVDTFIYLVCIYFY